MVHKTFCLGCWHAAFSNHFSSELLKPHRSSFMLAATAKPCGPGANEPPPTQTPNPEPAPSHKSHKKKSHKKAPKRKSKSPEKKTSTRAPETSKPPKRRSGPREYGICIHSTRGDDFVRAFKSTPKAAANYAVRKYIAEMPLKTSFHVTVRSKMRTQKFIAIRDYENPKLRSFTLSKDFRGHESHEDCHMPSAAEKCCTSKSAAVTHAEC